MVESGMTQIDGAFPVNPSGGVLSSNPIGASGHAQIHRGGTAGPAPGRSSPGRPRPNNARPGLWRGSSVFADGDLPRSEGLRA